MDDKRPEDEWTTIIDAEKRIKALEVQVALLNVKATHYDRLLHRVQALESRLASKQVSSNRGWLQSFLEWTGLSVAPRTGLECTLHNIECCTEESFDVAYRTTEPEGLRDEQLALSTRIKGHCSTPLDIESAVVGDVVEYITGETLNMSPAFQYKNILHMEETQSALATRYFWPVRILSITGHSRRVHYLGYRSTWDITLTEEWKNGRVRSLKRPEKPEAGFTVGDMVEVRLLQKTNEGDPDDDKAYCWCTGQIESLADGDIAHLRISEAEVGGIKRVSVAVAALRPLEREYPSF